jgi:hypothetical protein
MIDTIDNKEPANIIAALRAGQWDWKPTRSPEPTAAPPGTAEKIAEMAARVLRGEDLFHKDDTTADGRRCHEA